MSLIVGIAIGYALSRFAGPWVEAKAIEIFNTVLTKVKGS